MTTRRDFLAATAAALAARRAPWDLQGPQAAAPGAAIAAWQERPVPSAAQLAWQRDELALFLHFGVNTFTNREWGDGTERPAIFNPTRLDTSQWARTARNAGFRAMVLTAKHHDGFCLWPTRTTRHSVAASPYRNGQGDVVREFVDACRAHGLRPGLYCSPWDRNHPAYGDSPRYNDIFCDQLTELLTQYGEIHEVWFDGANGEGPNGKKQEYDFPRFWSLVKRLQPNAVIFSDAGPDIRWIGNERGVAGETNWSTVNPATVPVPGLAGEHIIRALQTGDRDGTVWRPGETDVSIRPGWFYHPEEDARVRTIERLVDLYFTSVGRNSKLLLNVPPTREGQLHTVDSARLVGMRTRLNAIFRSDLAARKTVDWQRTGASTAIATLDLGATLTCGIADLREQIQYGQMVAQYVLEGSDGGEWMVLSRGTTIGYRKLDRFTPVQVRHVRLTIEDAAAPPRPVSIGLYAGV